VWESTKRRKTKANDASKDSKGLTGRQAIKCLAWSRMRAEQEILLGTVFMLV